jgi:hypothetical protein
VLAHPNIHMFHGEILKVLKIFADSFSIKQKRVAIKGKGNSIM